MVIVYCYSTAGCLGEGGGINCAGLETGCLETVCLGDGALATYFHTIGFV